MTNRRTLLVLAVLIGSAAGVALWRPDLAPHTREQARIMGADSVWAAPPQGLTETMRWTTYARPTWLPWQPDVPRTSVGRHYEFTGDVSGVFDSWHNAAVQAGWRPVRGVQTTTPGTEIWFMKTSGPWPARLVIKHNDLAEVFTVSIVMPSP